MISLTRISIVTRESRPLGSISHINKNKHIMYKITVHTVKYVIHYQYTLVI